MPLRDWFTFERDDHSIGIRNLRRIQLACQRNCCYTRKRTLTFMIIFLLGLVAIMITAFLLCKDGKCHANAHYCEDGSCLKYESASSSHDGNSTSSLSSGGDDKELKMMELVQGF